jgi:phosphotransferase system IIA component
VGCKLSTETFMKTRKQTKLVHEGDYLAEVDVELIESDDPWAPYLSPEEVRKLDNIRLSLRRGEVATVAKIARVFKLTPVTAA